MTASEQPGRFGATRVAALVNNPIAVKELRGRMRGRRAFVILTIYLLLLAVFISLVYLIFVAAAGSPGSTAGRQAGKVIFFALLVVASLCATGAMAVIVLRNRAGHSDV